MAVRSKERWSLFGVLGIPDTGTDTHQRAPRARLMKHRPKPFKTVHEPLLRKNSNRTTIFAESSTEQWRAIERGGEGQRNRDNKAGQMDGLSHGPSSEERTSTCGGVGSFLPPAVPGHPLSFQPTNATRNEEGVDGRWLSHGPPDDRPSLTCFLCRNSPCNVSFRRKRGENKSN